MVGCSTEAEHLCAIQAVLGSTHSCNQIFLILYSLKKPSQLKNCEVIKIYILYIIYIYYIYIICNISIMYYLHKLNHMPVGIGKLELFVVPSL